MAKENMFCPGQKILSAEGKKNWDRIFKKDKSEEGRDTTCHCTLDDHFELYQRDISVCPRCGEPVDPRIDKIEDTK